MTESSALGYRPVCHASGLDAAGATRHQQAHGSAAYEDAKATQAAHLLRAMPRSPGAPLLHLLSQPRHGISEAERGAQLVRAMREVLSRRGGAAFLRAFSKTCPVEFDACLAAAEATEPDLVRELRGATRPSAVGRHSARRAR